MPQQTRMHYVITAGGNAPNVVPDFAEVFYYLRHPTAALRHPVRYHVPPRTALDPSWDPRGSHTVKCARNIS